MVPAWHTTRPPTDFEKAEGIDSGHIFVEEDEFGLILDKDGFVLSDYEGEFMTGLSKNTVRTGRRCGCFAPTCSLRQRVSSC